MMAMSVNITNRLLHETELFERGFLKIFLLCFKAWCFVSIEAIFM